MIGHPLPAAAETGSPGDVFGTFFGEIIRRDMEIRRQRKAEAIVVRRIQAALQRLGYYSGSIDGDFGPGTQAALAAYRRDRDIPLDSTVTDYDVAAMEAQARDSANVPQQPPAEALDQAEPPVQYSAVTPEEVWSNSRFSDSGVLRKGPLMPPDGAVWIVVASATAYENVTGAALEYAQDFPSTTIIRSGNGRHAILIGWLSKGEAKQLLDILKRQNILPSDAFVSSGQKFVGPVWTTDSAGFKSPNDILRHGFLRASSHLWNRVLNAAATTGFGDYRYRVHGVEATDGPAGYLSLRRSAGVSAAEKTQMPEGTLVRVLETKDGWSRVRLLDGREGWASAKYLALNSEVLGGSNEEGEGEDEIVQSAVPETMPYGDKDLQDRLTTEGSALLRDADRFLKTHPEIDNITAFAEAAGRLNTALASRDFGGIEAATSALKQLLDNKPSYKDFEKDLRNERERAESEALAKAERLAGENAYFLKTHIALNVTAPEASLLAGLLKELDAARREPSRTVLDGINQRIDAAIAKYEIAAKKAEILRGYIPQEASVRRDAVPGSQQTSQAAQEANDQDSRLKQEELRKIANDAESLLDQLGRFSATGKQVVDVHQAARLVVNLRSSLKSGEGAAILRDYKALSDLLSKDQAFAAFRQQEQEAAKLKDARQREAASQEAARVAAFIDSYIAKNFTSDNLEALIDVQDKLRAATKDGQGPDLFRTVDNAHVRIKDLGLESDLSEFRVDDPEQESPVLVKCRSAVQQAQWSEATSLCKAALDEDKANTELAAMLKKATDAVEQQRQNEEQKKQKSLKLESARSSAAKLLDELSVYAASNGTLADPMAIARRVSALKTVIEGDDPAVIAAANEALSAILAHDQNYRSYREDKQRKEGDLDLAQRSAQTAEARRLKAFIASYVSRNVTAAGLGDLLAADDQLSRALEQGGTRELREANEAATNMIVKLQAGSELAQFRLTVEQPAEIKTCLDLVQAQDWDKADAACQAALKLHPNDASLVPARKAIDSGFAEGKERERKEALVTARKKAGELLTRIDAFAKGGQTFKDQAGMVARVAELQRGISGSDGAALLESLDAVKEALKAETGFAAYVTKQDEEARRSELDALAEGRAETKRIKSFIEDFLTKNISSPHSPSLTDAVTALNVAAAGTSLSAINDANKKVLDLLEEVNLGQEIKDFTLAPKQVAQAPASTPNEIILDDRNRPLLEGDGDDILLLFNNSGRARHVRRDLVGKIAFNGSVPVCWYHPLPLHDLAARMTYQALEAAGAKTMELAGVCDAAKLDEADIVALRRKDFLATDRQYAKPLVDHFVAGSLVQLAAITATAVRDRQRNDDKLSFDISADLKAGIRKGFGVLAVGGDGTPLCFVAGVHADALSLIMSPWLKTFTGSLAGRSIRQAGGADDAFARIRGGECTGVIGSASDLSQLMTAAARENLPYRLLPLWIDDKEVLAAQLRLDADKAERLRAEEARKRVAEDALKQEEIRQQRLGETKRKEEAELRDRFGATARGLAATLGDGIKGFIVKPGDPASHTFAGLFGRFSQWYQDQIDAGWELESDGYVTDLADYGTVQWQSREVDAIFIQAAVRMKHRDLGKYQQVCFVVGAIVDSEFVRFRDVFESPCESTEPDMMDWKTAHRFNSRWIVP